MAGRSGSGPARGQRGSGQRLDRIPFRRKLNALISVPCVFIVVVLAPTVVGQVDIARGWHVATGSMRATSDISSLIGSLAVEQEDALGIGHDQLLTPATYEAQVGVTGRAVAAVASAFHGDPPPALAAALSSVNQLAPVRAAVVGGAVNGQQLLAAYAAVMDRLGESMGVLDQASTGSPAGSAEGELALLLNAGLAQDQYGAALADVADNPGDLRAELPVAQAGAAVAVNFANAFEQIAPTGFDGLLRTVQADTEEAALAGFAQNAAAALYSGATAFDASGGSAELDSASSVTGQAIAQSQATAQMQQDISRQIILSAQHSATVAAWTAVGLVALAMVLLVLLIIFSVLIRHSIVRPVLRLTRAATRIATVAEQDLERVADDTVGGEAPLELETVRAGTRDEIGDLAESFNRLQSTAVRVLERQVAIRRNTAEMFGNVGRRIHNLTGRQLALIDTMERAETNPVLLERLYRIDHLAVRLQRGADSLVLLSGESEPSLDATPLPLTDVVRSAAGRIEGYQRVVLTAEGDATVVPSAIGDLTLMVAELVENAVSFSPGSSTVDVTVSARGRGAHIAIVDRGVGMSPKRVAEENERLVRRERLDLLPSKVLGLFVVGRLAQRTGAQVALEPTPGGGLTATISIPAELLLDSAAISPDQRVTDGLASVAASHANSPLTASPVPRLATSRSVDSRASRSSPVSPVSPSLPEQRGVDAPNSLPRRTARHAGQPSRPLSPPIGLSQPPRPQPAPTAPAPRPPTAGPGTGPDAGDALTVVADALTAAASARTEPHRSPFADPASGREAFRSPGQTVAPARPAGQPSAPAPAPTAASAVASGLPALPRRKRANRADSTPLEAGAADRPTGSVQGAPVRRSAMALAPATALDAETARATIEEFEAAVDQALRDSARDINQLIDSSDRAGSAGPTGFDDEKGARP